MLQPCKSCSAKNYRAMQGARALGRGSTAPVPHRRGKKAKRKAREKQLEEARRLASLQKKRELKAAGIEMRDMKRKTRGINYNNEVAFEKRPTAGFYDVGEERQLTKDMGQEFRPVTLEEMEGKRRKVGPQRPS